MSEDIHRIQERAKLTGLICTQYSYFDYLISNIIWDALGVEKEVGMIVTGSMDIRPKIEMAISLLDHINKNIEIRGLLQQFKNKASSSSGFISKRNIIVHGIYSSREGDPKVMVEAHRKIAHRERREITIEFIKECHDSIIKANKDLVELMEIKKINVD
jgi:hypothetical protein